jgi:hypothetical protein
MEFLQGYAIEKSSELTHPPSIQSIIILILRMIYHLEITAKHPGSMSNLTEVAVFVKECWLVFIGSQTIDRS